MFRLLLICGLIVTCFELNFPSLSLFYVKVAIFMFVPISMIVNIFDIISR